MMPGKTLCPNCGTPYFPEDQFCSGCGDPIPKTPPSSRTSSSSLGVPIHSTPFASQARGEEIKGYVQIIGIVEIVFGALSLIGAVFIGIAGFYIHRFITEADTADSGTTSTVDTSTVASFATILFFAIAALLLAYGVLAIVSGKRLLEYRASGRMGTMIIGALSLISFPFGTIFGIAALYVLTRPEAEPLFS
ncbi:MAG: hypothetical protein ACFFB3_01835 [Candidatus Hodarchaeota archaeon]